MITSQILNYLNLNQNLQVMPMQQVKKKVEMAVPLKCLSTFGKLGARSKSTY